MINKTQLQDFLEIVFYLKYTYFTVIEMEMSACSTYQSICQLCLIVYKDIYRKKSMSIEALMNIAQKLKPSIQYICKVGILLICWLMTLPFTLMY